MRRLRGRIGCLVGWVIDRKRGCRIRVLEQSRQVKSSGLGNNTKSQGVSRVPSMEVKWSVSREIKQNHPKSPPSQVALSQHHILGRLHAISMSFITSGHHRSPSLPISGLGLAAGASYNCAMQAGTYYRRERTDPDGQGLACLTV